MQKPLNINITIVGLGLIGGSYAMAFKEINNGHVWGIDLNKSTLKEAADMNIIEKGYSDLDAHIPLEKSDVVIIAVYPEAAVRFVEENAANFKENAIITDVLGIKGKNINQIQNILLEKPVEFIGGHPMAGKESSGLSYASKSIFEGANYIITPTEKNSEEVINYIEKIVKNIGFKNISVVTPEKHDEIIAVTSQLPHVIAVSLMNMKNIDKNIKNFIGGSFRDESRVANINPELWSELFLSNRENLLSAVEEFQKSIDELKDALREEDSEKLKVIMKKASCKKGEIS